MLFSSYLLPIMLGGMVNSQELFKRRGDGGPDELFWEESDNIYSDVKNELLEHHKSVFVGILIF